MIEKTGPIQRNTDIAFRAFKLIDGGALQRPERLQCGRIKRQSILVSDTPFLHLGIANPRSRNLIPHNDNQIPANDNPCSLKRNRKPADGKGLSGNYRDADAQKRS